VWADARDFGWDNRSRRRWTSLAAFVIEIGIAAGLWLLPLLDPQAAPRLRPIESLPVLAALAGRAGPAPAHPQGLVVRTIGHSALTPRQVPSELPNFNPTDVAPPAELFGGGYGTEGDPGSKGLGNLLSEGLGTGSGAYLAPLNPPPSNHPPRISHSMEGRLIHQVLPEYPPLAKQARCEGAVLLRAVIDREGKIENLQVLAGHPLLVAAAVRAVQQWRYRPYYLNEQPVEVETYIKVEFRLSAQ